MAIHGGINNVIQPLIEVLRLENDMLSEGSSGKKVHSYLSHVVLFGHECSRRRARCSARKRAPHLPQHPSRVRRAVDAVTVEVTGNENAWIGVRGGRELTLLEGVQFGRLLLPNGFPTGARLRLNSDHHNVCAWQLNRGRAVSPACECRTRGTAGSASECAHRPRLCWTVDPPLLCGWLCTRAEKCVLHHQDCRSM